MNCQSIVVDLSEEQFHKVQTRDARPAPKKEGFPRPVKITKTCGAQRGKLDFNPLKFERKDLNYPNYVLGISRFTLSAEKTIGQWPCIVCIFFVYWPKFVQAMVCLITNRCWKLRHGLWIDQTIWKNIWRLRPTFPGSWWIHNLAKRSSKYGRQGVKAWQRGDFDLILELPICLNRIL